MPGRNPENDAPTVVAGPGRAAAGTIACGDGSIVVRVEGVAGTVASIDAVLSKREIATLQTPQTERFVEVRELGRGGMGRVDVVIDRALGRTVARKSSLSSDQRHWTLLVAEAQIGAQLEHPSIVPVYDIGTDADGRPHYTMRVVRGRTLRDVLDDNEVPGRPHVTLANLLNVFRQICLAVDYAHCRGVVHRDLKPENIIVGEFGEVYVLDWGVALVSEDSEIRRTMDTPVSFAVAGSPGYMSPEQALGEPIDGRTDVFSLGVVLYEILAGARPFEDADLPSIVRRIASGRITPPSRRRPDRRLPAVFDELVVQCLARGREERPAGPRLLADAVDGFLDGERQRSEREAEADGYAKEGRDARDVFEALRAEAHVLREKSEAMLEVISAWAPVEAKQDAWDLEHQSRRLEAEAARALARAESAFARALGRVADHHDARRAGLAALHYQQFLHAEEDGDVEKMAQYLDLARAFDDGRLRMELSDRGELAIETSPPGATLSVARYESHGVLLRVGAPREIGVAPVSGVSLESGSYLVTARLAAREIRYPVLVTRARVTRLRTVLPGHEHIPDGMVLVPGGPFLGLAPRAKRLATHELGDFAIGALPVTLRRYAEFLDSLEPGEQAVRVPGFPKPGAKGDLPSWRTSEPILERVAGAWKITAGLIEGNARMRVSDEDALDLPACLVSWYDALAYIQWLSKKTSRAYRLPTDLEWEKAMRGADGRNFPMGNHLDPAFAKLRESRPEASQPEPVGRFPLDVSPYGVRDLAGGVGDWTSTFADGSEAPRLEHEGLSGADQRQAYWRGGTWGTTATSPRALRVLQMVRHRTVHVGFRVALSLPGESSTLTTEGICRDSMGA